MEWDLFWKERCSVCHWQTNNNWCIWNMLEWVCGGSQGLGDQTIGKGIVIKSWHQTSIHKCRLMHYYNSWVFFTMFSSKKKSKNDKCKRTTLSIWINCFGHVSAIRQLIWTLSFWLVERLTKWLTIWLVDSGPFD
jgi:hypothetical protein